MTALLTDEEIAGSAWKWGRDQPSIHLPDLVVGFENGARFARSIYEARLAEEAKVRAGLVEALRNHIEECSCGIPKPSNVDEILAWILADKGNINDCCLPCRNTAAALAAAKGIK